MDTQTDSPIDAQEDMPEDTQNGITAGVPTPSPDVLAEDAQQAAPAPSQNALNALAADAQADMQIEKMLHGARYKQLLENQISSIREKYSLRKVDVEILYYLSHCGQKDTPTDVREHCLLTKSHISQSVDHMSRMELLTMVPDRNDRRCVHLLLTPQARDIVAEIRRTWTKLQEIIFHDIQENEIQAFCQTARKIIQNMDTALMPAQHMPRRSEGPQGAGQGSARRTRLPSQ